MRERFPKGCRISARYYRAVCPSCRRSYAWSADFGNRRCAHCKRVVPISERALLPGEEREVMRLLMGVQDGRTEGS